ncbi:valine--tRNA ligase [Paracidobacterium acidisoli]|uniref:Valine--tRNA ligase n=1 Tax=Paracidobacterium acidisoli TaxID=2303751 RepID=A0A372ILN3_9BACT|nr:valine--tRNA ligase [Paracidobacterium acidisoli]MBT9332256.1 valine--tRNA ligase [Paracidobacterium acidisoli]
MSQQITENPAQRELPRTYDPASIEDRWAEYWVREHLFDQPTPRNTSDAPAFTVLLPPPNVTGNLHMGHMFEHAETDILIRWRRMCGDRTLWLPGTDHAGIATQLMVERQLATEGKTRQQMGREAFVERVWQWKQHYGGAILSQMKRLGASVDWSREYFTMSDQLSVAVKEVFVRLHEQGLIYRATYIVNWCPRCQTAISDLEVVHEEQQGKLWEIRYPVIPESGDEPVQFLTVATTRPETMLGDTAVAVNPDDERYRHLHGKRLRLPLVGREIPVITDAWVSADFGTGAVKVTPAHDPNDFAIGQRHGLEAIDVMDETAHMNAAAGVYAGLDRYEARKRILEDLEAQGLLGAIKDHTHAVGRCDRCKTVVEPRLSKQWFVKIQPLADKAIAAVEQGYIRFTPEQYAKTYFEWMRNIHDWCISRQLWWGHRIPAWHCGTCGQITVARDTPAQCAHCGSAQIVQETDVLDTWFSSGLLPFTAFGWPEHTRDLDVFYPTQLLVTGFDILFFWVARMIMLGCHFMLDVPMPDGSERTLKDAVPFREVYIHALVRDADRQKMSKTKGNVIDPIEIVQKYGTDAVRFTLASMASPGTDIAFSEARTEGYRAFANKIWNAARFIFMNVEKAREAGIEVEPSALGVMPAAASEAPLEARWIVSALHRVAAEINAALESYRFDEAASYVYQFFWGSFCDWYLEIVKLRLDFSDSADKGAAKEALTTLLRVFESSLRLLSPFMPFLTEELWHALYQDEPPAKSIALSRYPQPQPASIDAEVESGMAALQDLIVSVRAGRKDLGVEEKAQVPVRVRTAASFEALFTANQAIIERMARVSAVEFVAKMPEGSGARTTTHFDVQVIYEKQIDAAAERERLGKDLAKYEKGLASAERQLNNEAFLAKAPAHVVDGLRKQEAETRLLLEKTRRALEELNHTK